jgi:hypothetical protein
MLSKEKKNYYVTSGMKSHASIIILMLISLAIVLVSCEITNQDEYTEYVVVEAYAVANRPLPHVQVSKTTPVVEFYDAANNVLMLAIVQITLLDENGGDEMVFPYRFSLTDGGVFVPVNTEYIVEPRRSYRLDVTFNDRSEVIRAVTTVPDTFDVISEVPERVVYQSENQLEITISQAQRLGSQNIFVFSSVALEPEEQNLTPFYKASVEDEDLELEDVIITSSGLINEGNFDLNPDGTITLRFPWIGVAFYGENLVVTSLVDRNINDLIRSQQVQLGGSTLSPGEIPNLIYNVEGGIGVFGSISTDTVKTVFVRPGF